MRSRILFLICSTLILLGGCREEKKDVEPWLDPGASATNAMPDPPPVPEAAAGTTVVVTLNDGHIATQESAIPPGPAVITVMNAGQEVHKLHVEGPGVSAAMEETIANGGSGTLNVTFQRGTYEFYCSVLDHRQNGETLTVQIPTE